MTTTTTLPFPPATRALAEAARALRDRRERVVVYESTSGGLISASLLSQPGASAYFAAGAQVYAGKGAKRLVPSDALARSGLMDRVSNYKDEESYVRSKIKYADAIARDVREHYKADWCLVESGTTGPDFYIPGVDRAFTAVGVAGPDGTVTTHLYRGERGASRVENMMRFTEFAIEKLRDAVVAAAAAQKPPASRL